MSLGCMVLMASWLGAGAPEVAGVAAAPQAASNVPTPAAASTTPWWRPLRDRLPTPLGFAGVAGMGVGGVMVVVGMGLAAVAASQVAWGRGEQARWDGLNPEGSGGQQQARATALGNARDAFDRASWLGTASVVALCAAAIPLLVGGVLVVVDETWLVPALRSRHPLWSATGPVLGYQEPMAGWPPLPVPQVPGLTVAPTPDSPPRAKPSPAPPAAPSPAAPATLRPAPTAAPGAAPAAEPAPGGA